MSEYEQTRLGVVDFWLPSDWLDLLADTDEAVTRHLARVIGAGSPGAPADRRATIVAGVLAWRALLQEQGTLVHGIVTAPHADGGDAAWHVLAGVVEFPSKDEIDLCDLLARRMRIDFNPDASHIEVFSTEMGLGVGLILQPDLQPPTGLLAALGVSHDEERDAFRIGLAAALSCPLAGAYALLVVGACANPEHVRELAAVVAMIASRSIVRPEPA